MWTNGVDFRDQSIVLGIGSGTNSLEISAEWDNEHSPSISDWPQRHRRTKYELPKASDLKQFQIWRCGEE
jgi:hypothetical protein